MHSVGIVFKHALGLRFVGECFLLACGILAVEAGLDAWVGYAMRRSNKLLAALPYFLLFFAVALLALVH